MKNLRNEAIEKVVDAAADYLKKIKPENKVLIAHGHDNDSICSATIIFKLLEKILKNKPGLFTTETNFAVTESDAKKIVKLKPDFLIVVDISDININVVTQLAKASKAMVIDHHKPKGYARIVYVNPRIFDGELYLPASYICYKIFERFFDPSEIVWIAGVGTLSDMGMKNTQDLFSKIKLVNKELVNGLNPVDEDLFEKSLLGKLSKVLDGASVLKKIPGVELALKILTETKSYKEILEGKTADSKKLVSYFETVDSEFKRIIADFNKNKKQMKNFLVYEIKSKMNMKSPVATNLAKFFDDKILVIMQKENNSTNVSLRRGKSVTVDLTSLAQSLVKGIPNSNGGGHPQAAGCGFPNKDAKIFMKNLAEIASVGK